MQWFYSTQWLLHKVVSGWRSVKYCIIGQGCRARPSLTVFAHFRLPDNFPRLHLLSRYFSSKPLAFILHSILSMSRRLCTSNHTKYRYQQVEADRQAAVATSSLVIIATDAMGTINRPLEDPLQCTRLLTFSRTSEDEIFCFLEHVQLANLPSIPHSHTVGEVAMIHDVFLFMA